MLFRKLVRSWVFDVAIGLIILLGIFYITNISEVNAWSKQAFHSLSSFYSATSKTINSLFLHENSGRILILVTGLIAFLILLAWRIIWRLQGSKRFSATTCPKCSDPLVRVKSSEWVRKIRPLLPLRRFYCRSCGWKGIRIKGNDRIPLNIQPGKPTSIHVDKIS